MISRLRSCNNYTPLSLRFSISAKLPENPVPTHWRHFGDILRAIPLMTGDQTQGLCVLLFWPASGPPKVSVVVFLGLAARKNTTI